MATRGRPMARAFSGSVSMHDLLLGSEQRGGAERARASRVYSGGTR